MGQALDQPVGRLLGGRHRQSVLPYASVLIEDCETLTDGLRRLAQLGFGAFKIGWGHFGRIDQRTDEGIVACARSAIGDDCLLAVDAGGSDASFPGRLAWARCTARMLESYDVAWFEEPLPPDALADFVTLRHSSSVAISGGEVLTRRQSFLPFLAAGAFDIVQPDQTKCGGLSEARRIGFMAGDHGVTLVPHGWNTAVGLAADLQLASALADTDLVEYKTGAAYIDELVAEPWQLDEDGRLPIPSGPGLGIQLDPDALERWGTNPTFADPTIG